MCLFVWCGLYVWDCNYKLSFYEKCMASGCSSWLVLLKFPCSELCALLESSILYVGCKHWVHKKCSRLKTMENDPVAVILECVTLRDILSSWWESVGECWSFLLSWWQVLVAAACYVQVCLGRVSWTWALAHCLFRSNVRSSMLHATETWHVSSDACQTYVEMTVPWFAGCAESGLLMSLIWRTLIRSSVLKTSPYLFVDVNGIDCDWFGMSSAPPAKSVGSHWCN